MSSHLDGWRLYAFYGAVIYGTVATARITRDRNIEDLASELYQKHFAGEIWRKDKTPLDTAKTNIVAELTSDILETPYNEERVVWASFVVLGTSFLIQFAVLRLEEE